MVSIALLLGVQWYWGGGQPIPYVERRVASGPSGKQIFSGEYCSDIGAIRNGRGPSDVEGSDCVVIEQWNCMEGSGGPGG